jgi:hypothetical protein
MPKALEINSIFPDLPLLDLSTMEYTNLFALGARTQLVVLEFYVSQTRSVEPIIAIDP